MIEEAVKSLSENLSEENAGVYKFTDEELTALALFFRKNTNKLPEELDLFSKFVEYYIYDKMTIAEAENFFKE